MFAFSHAIAQMLFQWLMSAYKVGVGPPPPPTHMFFLT